MGTWGFDLYQNKGLAEPKLAAVCILVDSTDLLPKTNDGTVKVFYPSLDELSIERTK